MCRRCGEQGRPRDSTTRRLAHEPFGWRSTILLVTVRCLRCGGCGLAASGKTKIQKLIDTLGAAVPAGFVSKSDHWAEPGSNERPKFWPTSTGRAPATDPPRRSTDVSSTCMALLLFSQPHQVHRQIAAGNRRVQPRLHLSIAMSRSGAVASLGQDGGTGAACDDRLLVANGAGAGPKGPRQHRIGFVDSVNVVPHDRYRLFQIAGVDMHLPAAGCAGGKITRWPRRSSTVTVALATSGNKASARQVSTRAISWSLLHSVVHSGDGHSWVRLLVAVRRAR